MVLAARMVLAVQFDLGGRAAISDYVWPDMSRSEREAGLRAFYAANRTAGQAADLVIARALAAALDVADASGEVDAIRVLLGEGGWDGTDAVAGVRGLITVAESHRLGRYGPVEGVLEVSAERVSARACCPECGSLTRNGCGHTWHEGAPESVCSAHGWADCPICRQQTIDEHIGATIEAAAKGSICSALGFADCPLCAKLAEGQ